MIEITPVAAADPELSAGYHYRLRQPISELGDNVKIVPDGIRLIFGCWNDLRPEHYEHPYILDFDDLIWDMPHLRCPDPQRLFEVMRGARAITAASKRLATEIQKVAALTPVYYCRTGMDDTLTMAMEPKKPVVAWRGSRGWWRAMDYVRPHLPEDMTIIQGMPWKEYIRWLPTFDRTVEICPSYPGAFEACKSSIKLIQAMWQGVPVIASVLDPYGYEASCAGMPVFDYPSRIPVCLRQVLDAPSYRADLSVMAREYAVANFSLSETAYDFYEVWGRHAY